MNHASLYDHPDLYDLVMGESPAEGFYRDEALKHGGGVLELACGSGRLTIPLAKAGLDIVGLDLAPTMLSRARARARAAGVEVTWIEADMRHFDLGRRFGFIFIATNSLLHLATSEDLALCLASAAQLSRITWFFSASGRPDFLTVPLHLRNIFPQELPLLVRQAGFELAQRFGDFRRAPLESGSRHQVCLCRPLERARSGDAADEAGR